MANPQYGQNKLDAKLKTVSDAVPGGLSVAAHKAMSFDMAIADSGTANNTDTGYDIPAGSVVLACSIINTGATALASNAATLDVGGVDLTASLSALASGAAVVSAAPLGIYCSNATNILVDGSSGIVTGSGTTTLKVVIHYLDINAISA